MSKVMTRAIPSIGDADAWGICQVPEGGRPLRCIVEVIQSANNMGRAYVAFDSVTLATVGPSGIISDAYRIADGCSQNFKVEAGQKIFIAGTPGVFCSIHIYEASGDDEASC